MTDTKRKYEPLLTLVETEIAIKEIKDLFETLLAKALGLIRVSAPMFVKPESGLQDDLNGIERPVDFDVRDIQDSSKAQVVQSLAKWKRMALHKYGIKGLYTDMNAIRRDEDLDSVHSVYVDQWDWELVLQRKDRTTTKLHEVVRKIYNVFIATEAMLAAHYPQLSDRVLPSEITFFTSQELEDRWPDIPPREREDRICKEKGAVFISQIGGKLKSGQRHDGRAPDYDDWKMNGDIILWYEPLHRALEMSSMGIRVDEKSLKEQLEISGCLAREKFPFHRALLEGKLPLTMGGGIGQSRICQFFLRKIHIGEVQSSIWPESMMKQCSDEGIPLL